MSTKTLTPANGNATILDQGEFQWWVTTEHGIMFSEDTPREEWLKAVEQLTTMHESSGRLHFRAICILSDALNFGEAAYGEEYSEAIDASRAWMRVSAKTIQNAMWVMKQIPASRRRELLTLSHHEAVAALDPEEQDDLLTRAENDNLTVAELRKLVAAAHPKTKRGKDRQSKNGSEKPQIIATMGEAKAALLQCVNVLKENEEKITEAWESLLKDCYRLYRRKWMSGHKR